MDYIIVRYENTNQGTHSNCIFKFPVFSLFFPCLTADFPVPIYMICDYYIHKNDLADLSRLETKLEILVANIEISFTFRIREFTT